MDPLKTVIMAGGKGTRISKLFPEVPKPLIPIKNRLGEEKTVLEWEICSLRDQGFKDFIITVSYQAKRIVEYFEDGKKLGVNIEYYYEPYPLGNAGALFKLGLKEDFILLNADSMFDIDFNRMLDYHQKHDSLATILTHPNSHPYDSSLVICKNDGTVQAWLAKEDVHPQWYKNRVNAGVHILSPQALKKSEVDSEKVGLDGYKVDLDRQILKPLCGTGKLFAYDSPEYIKDMGTPERYEQVCHDALSGVIESKNLIKQQKAIFLDRDGTINVEKGFLRNIEEFELIDGVSKAIKKINNSGYLCIVATNQPVIARGEVTIEELERIHNKLETLLGNDGAYIDGLYYCPHHPDKGFEGEVGNLKIECECRKPKPGLLLKAAKDFNIDLHQSWMIGDSENDVLAGKRAGCHTALIGNESFESDLNGCNLNEIVDRVIR